MKSWFRHRLFAAVSKAGLSMCVSVAAVVVEAAEWPGFTRGMGVGGWLTNCKRLLITEADVKNIKMMGFDHIRLCFDQVALEEKPGVWRERTLRKVDDFIRWCASSGVNVVLNLHKAVGNSCDIQEKVQLLDDAGLQERFIALWLEFERRYADRPGVAFELLNEVRDVDPEKWNALADRAVRAIRAKNPNRWLVVGSTYWNSSGTLAALKVWEDPKVVYTFHMYEPFEFTHQRGVRQPCPPADNCELEYPSAAMLKYMEYGKLCGVSNAYESVQSIDANFLASRMAGAAAFVKAYPDKVLWLGEFGTVRHAPQRSRVAYMRDVILFAKMHGIPWCVWDYLSSPNDGRRFSLVDDNTRAFLSQELLSTCLGENIPKQRVKLRDCPSACRRAERSAPADATGLPTGVVGDVMTIDVSGCAADEAWPVETFADVDTGRFNCDVYKTDKLSFVRVHGGCAHAAKPDSRGELTAADVIVVSNAFWLGQFPVTAAQYARVMGADAATANRLAPKVGVSYNEIRSGRKTPDVSAAEPVTSASFFGRLSAKCRDRNGNHVLGFDLPTEVQWEVAARAGSFGLYGAFVKGDEVVDAHSENYEDYAWSWKSDYTASGATGKKGVQQVGLKCPNVWGFYDMAGNVYEWTRDNLGARAWTTAERAYERPSPYRVLRSGFFDLGIGDSRPSYRDMANAYWSSGGIGFRVALTCPKN